MMASSTKSAAGNGAATDGSFDYDLFVIGAGSGGVRCARVSSELGAKVAVAEDRYLGGTCVNVGCIPKKLFVYASHYSHDFEDAASYGWNVGGTGFDWETLRDNKDTEIKRLNGVYENLLNGSKVEIIEARATVTGPNEVSVGDRTVTARHILVATGGWPVVPDIPGREHAITSNEFFHMERWPRRILVVGGGYISVELTGILHGLGAEVTQLYRGPMFLRGFDDNVRSFLAEEMIGQGIDLRFDANVASIAPAGNDPGDGFVATLEDGTEIKTDAVLYATGRSPNTNGMGLEEAGVSLRKNGAVEVDDFFQTSVPSIHAIGDVIGRVALTPVAITEGIALAQTLFGAGKNSVDYANIPTAVFSQPPIGTVGLSEEKAREEHGEVDVYLSEFRPLRHTMTESGEQTLMKLIVSSKDDTVVGLHMVGPDAGEIIQGFAVALRCGATKAQFDATIGIHPTAAEEFVTMRTAKAAE